jgi:Bacterial regulatory proteins, lacI family
MVDDPRFTHRLYGTSSTRPASTRPRTAPAPSSAGGPVGPWLFSLVQLLGAHVHQAVTLDLCRPAARQDCTQRAHQRSLIGNGASVVKRYATAKGRYQRILAHKRVPKEGQDLPSGQIQAAHGDIRCAHAGARSGPPGQHPHSAGDPGRDDGRHPPRMEDAASVAGVCHQSVSRVLNDFPHSRPATRDRVLAAIEEFGYRRSTTARTLVTRRSGTIGVFTAHMNHFGPASIMLGLESASRAMGYSLSLAGLPEISAASLRTAVAQFLDQALEAVVFFENGTAGLALSRATPGHDHRKGLK